MSLDRVNPRTYLKDILEKCMTHAMRNVEQRIWGHYQQHASVCPTGLFPF
jgi:hypothetical protein